MLAVFWPVGLFLLFRKLTENSGNGTAGHKKSVRTEREYAEPGTQGVRQGERPVVRRRTEERRPGTQGVDPSERRRPEASGAVSRHSRSTCA